MGLAQSDGMLAQSSSGCLKLILTCEWELQLPGPVPVVSLHFPPIHCKMRLDEDSRMQEHRDKGSIDRLPKRSESVANIKTSGHTTV